MAALIGSPKKILIVKPSSMGDVVHTLPVLDVLRTNLPKAQIHWVIAKGLEPLLENHPQVDRLWVIAKDEWKKPGRFLETAGEIRRLFRALKAESFDLVIDLQGLLRSSLISWATRAPVRIGFGESKEGSPYFYTHRVECGMEMHAVERNLKLLSPLRLTTGSVRFPFPPLNGKSSVLGDLPENYAVIAPSAGKPANRWFPERFGELAARLPCPSVVVTGRGDAQLGQEVARASQGRAVSLGGKTGLHELIHIVKKARFMVCNDTGPMHIAAAFNVPVAAVFGPSNPVRTGPYGRIHTVVQEQLDCSPCYRKKRCREWRCMEAVTVDRVYEAIEKNILNRGGAA